MRKIGLTAHLQGDETYMRTEYDEWMEEMQPVLRNLPAYGMYLRCPEPAVCEPSHLQKSPDHVCLTLRPGVCVSLGIVAVFVTWQDPLH